VFLPAGTQELGFCQAWLGTVCPANVKLQPACCGNLSARAASELPISVFRIGVKWASHLLWMPSVVTCGLLWGLHMWKYKSTALSFSICCFVVLLLLWQNETGIVRITQHEAISCYQFCSGNAIVITYSECVFVAVSMQCAYAILSSVVCLAVQHFSTLSNKRSNFLKKKYYWTYNVFYFSYKFCLKYLSF